MGIGNSKFEMNNNLWEIKKTVAAALINIATSKQTLFFCESGMFDIKKLVQLMIVKVLEIICRRISEQNAYT